MINKNHSNLLSQVVIPELNDYHQSEPGDLSLFLKNRHERTHPIYRAQLKSSLFYKLIFCLIAAFFIGISFFTYTLTTSWICTLYISNCEMVKGFISILSLILGIISFKLFYSICPKKETAYRLLRRAENKLIKIKEKLSVHHNVEELYPDSESDQKIVYPLKHDIITEKMYELYEEAIHLIEEISSHGLSDRKQKRQWLNQTFFNLQFALNQLVCFNYINENEEISESLLEI